MIVELDEVREDEGGGESSPPNGGTGAVRERILEFIKSRLPAGGHETLVTAKMIGEAVGVNPNNVAYHLTKLVATGEISTRGSGRQGTRIRLGGTPRQRRARRVGPEAAQAAGPAKPGRNFCPYCGGKVLAEDWRFCGACGKALE